MLNFAPAIDYAPEDITLPQYHGYISPAPGGRYFQDEDRQGFLVIGENDAITWPGLCSLLDGTSPEATEAYIRDLRAHGVTVSRVMLEYAQESKGFLENPVGVYSESVVAFWDSFIALAEKHGLYLLLTPYDTFWQAKKWHTYPYSSAAGGPCRTRRGWLTERACIDAQKARWDFVITRWGGSPNVFAWDIMNELDLHWGCSPAEVDAYITEMAAYVRQVELATWGRTHMLTASSAKAIPKGALAQAIYNHPALDFATTHLYVDKGIKAPKETIAAASEMAQGVQQSLRTLTQPRPYLDSESGPIDHWIKDSTFDQEYHHNMSWAHLAAGGAGSGMRWPYTKPHWMLPEFRANLRGLARFAAGINWAAFESRNIDSSIRLSETRVVKAGCADTRTAIVWLLQDTRRANAPLLEHVTVTIDRVLDDGAYCIELWETYTGTKLVDMLAYSTGGALSFTLPLGEIAVRDVAILIQKMD